MLQTNSTSESIRALLLSDIAAIRTADALKTWGRRWADDIKASPHRGEIKQAYVTRMEELANESV